MTPMNNIRKIPPMRRRIFAYLALFCVFAIAVLWVFQIVFLDRFYQTIMLHKINSAADSIVTYWEKRDTESLSAHVFDVAEHSGFCISVYNITGQSGELDVKAHELPSCLIHNFQSPAQLSGLYNDAKNAGGSAVRRYDLSSLEESVDGTTVVCVRTAADDSGEVMVLVNCDVFPVDSTVSTLRIQLVVITVILLAASALLATLISRRLSKPVTKISEEAKLLATGDYSVRFDAGGYREIAELADTLSYTASELGKVDKMQKELIANISHDLRTPLTMISGYSEVMRDIPGEMTAENMQIIIDETSRLTSLVNDVLDLSRLTSGKLELKNERFSLTSLVSEAMERYAHLKEREGYDITFTADENCEVIGDPVRISQVLYNLVNNAINYTGEDKTVRVAQQITGSTVRISVTDTGDGIPEEKLPLIWERYYKASEYHRRGAIGSGLGLSIVKGILDAAGAAYGVSSALGHGSTFWFELPLAPKEPDLTKGGDV